MENYTFESDIESVGGLKPIWNLDELSNETMLFSASPAFAIQNGGIITQTVMDFIMAEVSLVSPDKDYPHAIIDTRVHMLMPGQYPAIPGWHCDNAPRGSYESQPDLKAMSKSQQNYTVIVSSERRISRTEFLDTEGTFIPYDQSRVWGSVDEFLQTHERVISTLELEEGILTRFNGPTLHRAQSANKRGWRYFFRLSFMRGKPMNQIRNQVQVYATLKGW